MPGLKVTSAEKITPEAFIKYEQSPQESLPESEEQKVKQAEGGDKWAVFWLWDSYYRGNNGIKPDSAKADKWLHEFVQKVWVVRFEPVGDFAPASPQEFLKRVNQYAHTSSGGLISEPAASLERPGKATNWWVLFSAIIPINSKTASRKCRA